MSERAAIEEALAALDKARDALRRALHGDLPPPSEHRRLHRPGRRAKIEADPELRAFVEDRIDRMTFEELADAIAERFPPERQVKKSALHAWWKRHRKARTHPG